MRAFAEIEALAHDRHGADGVAGRLMTPKAEAELAAIPDDRWLADMTRRVFQAGFNWSVIDTKWDGFEIAFEGFDPARWAMMSDEDLDRLLGDARIVRHAAKIKSVQGNAAFLRELAQEHGSAGRFFAGWPTSAYVDLLHVLKARASRLGGTTAQYFLRGMGLDSAIFTRDVAAALVREGVVDKHVSSKRDHAAAQAAFNAWMEESGRPLTHVSQILALSVGAPPEG